MTAPVDWFRVLADLKERGWSLQAISVVTGIPLTTLADYRNAGAQPRHSAGESLTVLWCGAMGRTRHDIPRPEPIYGKP